MSRVASGAFYVLDSSSSARVILQDQHEAEATRDLLNKYDRKVKRLQAKVVQLSETIWRS